MLTFGVSVIKKMNQSVNERVDGLDLGWKESSPSSHSSTNDIVELLLAASQRFELEAGSVHASDYENIDKEIDAILFEASQHLDLDFGRHISVDEADASLQVQTERFGSPQSALDVRKVRVSSATED